MKNSDGDTKAVSKELARMISALLAAGAWKAVYYISHTEVVRATRRWYAHSNKPDKRRIEVLVSLGPPNFMERKFIAACKKAGEPFPVKRPQLKFRVYKVKKAKK